MSQIQIHTELRAPSYEKSLSLKFHENLFFEKSNNTKLDLASTPDYVKKSRFLSSRLEIFIGTIHGCIDIRILNRQSVKCHL